MLKSSSIKSLISISTLVLLFVSCSNQYPEIVLNGTRADIMSMLQSQDITQRATLPSNNFNFISENGTSIIAKPNSFIFEDSGDLATGIIDFEITELFTKSEILQYGIETRSINSIIESDGEFYFSASQNGQSLRLADNKFLSVATPNSDPNPGMELFIAAEDTWLPTGDSLNIFMQNGADSFNGYEFESDRLDWVNIDYFTKFDFDLTDISICLPEEYQDDKIYLWVVFKDIDVVLNSSGENLPIGEDISIVCIAAVSEDIFRIDIRDITVQEGLKINLNPKLESAENINILLKDLD